MKNDIIQKLYAGLSEKLGMTSMKPGNIFFLFFAKIQKLYAGLSKKLGMTSMKPGTIFFFMFEEC